jgi:DNA-binding NarL/FixJ family response regulator
MSLKFIEFEAILDIFLTNNLNTRCYKSCFREQLARVGRSTCRKLDVGGGDNTRGGGFLNTCHDTESGDTSAASPAGRKILLVDDHVLLREALRGALKELESEAAIFEASDSRETMQFVEQHADLDLVLLDLNLPDRNGFAVLVDLRERYPSVSVVVMSVLQDRDNVVKALDLGAVGFIPKSAGRKVILGALQLVFSGGIYIPPQALSRPEPLPTPPTPSRSDAPDEIAALRPAVSPADLGVTERQLDVLALMMQGKSNKAICRVLNLAEPTVKNHVRALLKALKATNRTEAVIAVGELKWKLLRIANS